MKLVLASSSSNRQALLKAVGIPFTTHTAKINEDSIINADPAKQLVQIAQAKAEYVAAYEQNHLVIGADTNGFYRNRLLSKPKYKMEALEMLKTLSGKSHYMYTGWYAINTKNARTYSGISTTKVTFKDIPQSDLTNYVNDNDVVSWAVAYSPLNTLAAGFIDSISGSLTGFTHGLPLEQVYPVLKQEGVI